MLRYHGHTLKKIIDVDVDGGSYYKIYKDGRYITSAWTLNNAKEFINSYDAASGDYCWTVLC